MKEPPFGDQGLHELKFDGYRMIRRIDRAKVRFWSSNGKDLTEKFLDVIEEAKALPVKSAIMDGEIIVVDSEWQRSAQVGKLIPPGQRVSK